MSGAVTVYKGRARTITLQLGEDTTGDTLTSEIRNEPARDSALIVTWTVTPTDETEGVYELSLTETQTGQVVVDSGYMDVKRIPSGGSEAVPVFDTPL